MHNGECYRACGCDPVAQARADERQRIVAKLRNHARMERIVAASDDDYTAYDRAADLIESETT